MSTARRVDKLRARCVSARSPRWRRAIRTVVVAGDSLCGGRAPGMLSQRLEAAGADVGVAVVARGGVLIDEVAAMLARYEPPHGSASVVGAIILAGGNYLKVGNEPTMEAVAAWAGHCLATATSRWPASLLVLCTVPLPGAHPALRPDAPALASTVINPAIRAAAATFGAVLCELETVFQDHPGARSDGVHPTAFGDRLVADRWFRALEPLLHRRDEP